MTSAPKSPNLVPAIGPANIWVASITLKLERAPFESSAFFEVSIERYFRMKNRVSSPKSHQFLNKAAAL